MTDIKSKTTATAGMYLTFNLVNETYGIEILKVQEIIQIIDVTRLPKTPNFVRGVINLRGRIIPVLDLRLKFGFDSVAETDRTCIIVVQVSKGEGSQLTMGIIVDEVSEVLDIESDMIEPTPEFGTDVDTDFILGIGKVELKVIMLLDVDKVLTTEEIQEVSQVGDESL